MANTTIIAVTVKKITAPVPRAKLPPPPKPRLNKPVPPKDPDLTVKTYKFVRLVLFFTCIFGV